MACKNNLKVSPDFDGSCVGHTASIPALDQFSPSIPVHCFILIKLHKKNYVTMQWREMVLDLRPVENKGIKTLLKSIKFKSKSLL